MKPLHEPKSLSIDGALMELLPSYSAWSNHNQSSYHLLQCSSAELAGMAAQVIRSGI